MFIALGARFSLLQRLIWMWFMTAKMLHPAPSKQGAISHYLSWWISLLLLNQCHLMLLAVWRTGLLAHAPIILIRPCPIHQSYIPLTLYRHWWERGGTDVQQTLKEKVVIATGSEPLDPHYYTVDQYRTWGPCLQDAALAQFHRRKVACECWRVLERVSVCVRMGL